MIFLIIQCKLALYRAKPAVQRGSAGECGKAQKLYYSACVPCDVATHVHNAGRPLYGGRKLYVDRERVHFPP